MLGMDEPTPEQQLRQAVGARIARLRAARGVTQEPLAERVQMAPQTIRHIEPGHTTPPLRRLLDLATALGVHLTDLFEEADAQVPPPTWDTEEAAVIEVWRATPPDQRLLLLDVMRRFAAPR
jgi:transcriptional regulator with XRE-family HTH domain